MLLTINTSITEKKKKGKWLVIFLRELHLIEERQAFTQK